ncbi:MAG: hypothetical protein JW913_06300 [Chitinispirillaceae bacterium]|nr:hypothetical protein [Chitinispirillaceae bacterium]
MTDRQLFIFTSALLLLLTSCTHLPTEPQKTANADHYAITIPALYQDSIQFSYTASSGSRFILPYHFFDNPLESLSGPLVSGLSVIDADGVTLDTLCETEQIGPIANRIVILPDGAVFPVTFRYRLDLSVLHHDSAAKMMPAVHIRDGSLFLIGAYCFILPHLGTSLTGLWRTGHPVTVTVEASPGITPFGIPSRSYTCANLYELLFLQLSAGHAPIAGGHGGGTDFVFIDYLNKSYPPGQFDSLALLFGTILNDIASRYGPFAGAPYTVGIHNIWGGLEGSYGFAIGEPAEGPGSRFGEILAHEALHYFIGIHCGEYDDQWWKESAATYLGLETAVRLGCYEKEFFRKSMTTRFDLADTLRFQHPLSDPWLRSHLFPDTLHALVYGRGAQVMMLLDVCTRIGSDNRSTLHHVTADLCRRFSGSAFGRMEFISTLRRYGAVDAPALFSAYVDTPDSVMSAEMLKTTFGKLDSLAPY